MEEFIKTTIIVMSILTIECVIGIIIEYLATDKVTWKIYPTVYGIVFGCIVLAFIINPYIQHIVNY